MTPAERKAAQRERERLGLVPVRIGKNAPLAVPREKADEAYRMLAKYDHDAGEDVPR